MGIDEKECHKAMLIYFADYVKLGFTTHLCVEHKDQRSCKSNDRLANKVATEDIPEVRSACGVSFEELPTRTT